MAPTFALTATLLATLSACTNVVSAASRPVPSSILYSQSSNDDIPEIVLAKGLGAALPASLSLGFNSDGKLFETGNLVSRARLNVLIFAAVSEDELVSSQASSVLPKKRNLPSSEDALHLGQLACSFVDLYPQSRVAVVADAANALPEGLPTPIVVSATQHALAINNDSSLSVWLPQVDGDSESAIDLAIDLMSAALRDGSSQQGNSPDMLVLLVSGKDAKTKVFEHVNAINDIATKQYGRINMKVVLVNQRDSCMNEQVLWTGRRLQEATDAPTTGTPTAAPAKPTTPLGNHDVIMIWTSIIVLLIVLVVFCCVGWSSELDPLLNTGFKSESGLKTD